MTNDYKVLYRKYRPTTFDEIVGQKYSITMLKNAVKNNKISHAYIFTGPRGTGKTSTAKIFARTINCENAKDGVPCGTCRSCLDTNNSDIIEIDAASNNGVDDIRELINNVKIAPAYSKYKIYIIDEVHELSERAFNALLLTLEEPPSHIVFIFATTNIESVPITILSRCQRYDFKKLSDDELNEHLRNIANKENIDITDEAIEEITYLSDGGCRDALSILNQLYTSNEHIDLDTVLNNYGSVSLVQIKNIVESFINNQYDQIKDIFNHIDKSSIDYKVFIKKLVDQLFIKALQYKSDKNDTLYLKIKDTIFELNDIIAKININVDPFMLIFLILIKNVDIPEEGLKQEKKESKEKVDNSPIKEAKAKQIENKVSKLDNLSETKNNIQVEQQSNYIEELKKVRINNCFAKADKSLLLASKEDWKIFNEKISSTDMVKSIIIDADVVLSSPDINIVVDLQESIVNMFNENLTIIEEKYAEIVRKNKHFIALTNDEWELYKKDYVKKLKEKYKYQILEEPINIENKVNKKVEKNDDYEKIISIFDKEKVEIK